jgi:hypothetical protein
MPKTRPTKNVFLVLLVVLLEIAHIARAFNYSSPLFSNDIKDGNHTREGKFLFDSLFGLELEEELINAAAASENTLKSCDCGKRVEHENESVRKQLSESSCRLFSTSLAISDCYRNYSCCLRHGTINCL